MYEIIKRPLMTEKNTIHAEQGVYTFEVDSKATKDQIKKAVEKVFRVKVHAVNTQNCRGRAKRFRFNVGGVRYWKKALVKLAPGEKIQLFEGV